MEKNTEPENQEKQEFLDPEKYNSEEKTQEDNEKSPTDSEAEFEEKEGEFLQPEEKIKPGVVKTFIFLILLFGGAGGYLYSNNLIPDEILELVFPKSSPSPPIITKVPPTPLPFESNIEGLKKNQETSRREKLFKEEIEEIPATTSELVPEILETNDPLLSTSGDLNMINISGNEENRATVHISGKEEKIAASGKKESEKSNEPQEITEFYQETEHIANEDEMAPLLIKPKASELDPQLSGSVSEPLLERDESTQAYLDFIESTAQKIGIFIKEGLIWAWDFLKEKLR